MKWISRLFTILLVLGVAAGGGYIYLTQNGEVPDPIAIAPARVAAEPEVLSDRSVINVPFSVPLARVEAEINAEIPNVLVRINERRNRCVNEQLDLLIVRPTVRIDCRIRGVIRKDGDLELIERNGNLQVRFPVRFRFDVEGVDGLVDGMQQRVTGAIEVRAIVVPTLQRDWDFVVDLEPNFRWTERAHTNILGIDFDFADQLRPEVQKALNGIRPQIRRLLQSANIRQTVARVWRQLQQPQRLATNPSVWLLVSPERVLFSGFEIRNEAIGGRVALVVNAETRAGGRPDAVEPSNLPNLGPMEETMAQGFDLSIPVTINYGLIARALEGAQLGDRIAEAVDPEQTSLALSGFEVYPSGEALTIGFDFAATTPGGVGNSQGRAYVSAVPRVNWDRKTLRLTQMQFASVANNAVVNAATFVIGQRPIMELAEQSAWISFSNEFDGAMEAVNSALTQDLGEGARSVGNLQTSSVRDLSFTEEGVRVVVSLGGELRIDVSN